LEHERENAAEQRITELYTRAVDQLGAEKAPVRLAVRAYLIRRSSHRPAVRLAVEAQLGGRHTATQAALKRPYRRRTARGLVRDGGQGVLNLAARSKPCKTE